MSERPTVVVSFAQSLDGRIATVSGDSRWISGNETLTLAHELRRDNDAILVGIGTVTRDDPELTCRLPGKRHRSPIRIVLDSRLRLPCESRILRTAARYGTIVACLKGNTLERRRRLEDRGATVLECRRDAHTGGIDLNDLLHRLFSLGIGSLFVEGGGNVITSFIRQRLLDRLVVVIAPLLIGSGIPAVGDIGTETLEQAVRLHPAAVRQLGCDLVWEMEFSPQS